LNYIAACPTAFHTVEHTASLLRDAGYEELFEGAAWSVRTGGRYYTKRNGSSIIAFRVPKGDYNGFLIAAAHGDSPLFRIKENEALINSDYIRLSTEKYGGMILSTWLDRPLSIAGRVTVRTEKGLATALVDLKDPIAVIPNVAIHQNREVNNGYKFNPAVDLLPLVGTAGSGFDLKKAVADQLSVRTEDLLSTELFLYNAERGICYGDLISAPRLDDLQCAFAATQAFLSGDESTSMPMLAIFDNEEVGSTTKQGAASTFLFDVLSRVESDPTALRQKLASSLLVSCDNAHAIHPNHPEYADKNHTAKLNAGIVIKYNANQKYTTDAISAGIFELICEKAGVPVQRYANRADMAGGSTLGNIATTQVSINAIDIGLPQLAMHSSYETAGAKDTGYYVKALTCFYGKKLFMESDGEYKFI
jgi:aspartyl aminopeptidase